MQPATKLGVSWVFDTMTEYKVTGTIATDEDTTFKIAPLSAYFKMYETTRPEKANGSIARP